LASKIANQLASLARNFSPLTDLFYILGQLFPDLASNNSEQLASLASVLKNVSTHLPMDCFFVVFYEQADFVRVAHPDRKYSQAAEDTCVKLSSLVEK
jgi:hypothetical protein